MKSLVYNINFIEELSTKVPTKFNLIEDSTEELDLNPEYLSVWDINQTLYYEFDLKVGGKMDISFYLQIDYDLDIKDPIGPKNWKRVEIGFDGQDELFALDCVNPFGDAAKVALFLTEFKLKMIKLQKYLTEVNKIVDSLGWDCRYTEIYDFM